MVIKQLKGLVEKGDMCHFMYLQFLSPNDTNTNV